MMDTSLLNLCTSSESLFWFVVCLSSKLQLAALVEHPWGETTTIGGKLWTELWQLLGRWILSAFLVGGKVWKGWLPTWEAPMAFLKISRCCYCCLVVKPVKLLMHGLPGWWGMCFKPGGSECIQRSICCWTNLIHDPFGKLTPDLFIPSKSSRSESYSLLFFSFFGLQVLYDGGKIHIISLYSLQGSARWWLLVKGTKIPKLPWASGNNAVNVEISRDLRRDGNLFCWFWELFGASWGPVAGSWKYITRSFKQYALQLW